MADNLCFSRPSGHVSPSPDPLSGFDGAEIVYMGGGLLVERFGAHGVGVLVNANRDYVKATSRPSSYPDAVAANNRDHSGSGLREPRASLEITLNRDVVPTRAIPTLRR